MFLNLLSVGVLYGGACKFYDGRADISCAHISGTGTYLASLL